MKYAIRRCFPPTAVVVLCAVGCGWSSGGPPGRRSGLVDVQTHAIQVSGDKREFRVAAPRDLQDNIALLIAFHGTGDDAGAMVRYAQLEKLPLNHQVIVVHPQARRGMWSTVQPLDSNSLEQNPGVQFFDAILAYLQERFPIDPSRIYIAGMSNGGSFAQVLSHARSTRIAAVAAHSAGRPKSLPAPARKFPVLLMAGGKDHAAPAVRASYKAYIAQGHPARLIIAPGAGHEWSTEHNETVWQFLSGYRAD